jgi:ubiquinone biosynthesis protein UbiJ
MTPAALALPFSGWLNRILADYPLARERLAPHAGKVLELQVGPLSNRLRIGRTGDVEPLGEGADSTLDLVMRIPLARVPGLAAGDESAFKAVHFSGDSELASVLSTIARNVEWDVEEDLSRVVGDIAAHRIVHTAKTARSWAQDAHRRLNDNMAEYLTEESRLFIRRDDLESLTRENETLRDDVARLEARVNRLSSSPDKAS